MLLWATMPGGMLFVQFCHRDWLGGQLEIDQEDIQQEAGSLQLCSGQVAGAEAAIHGVNFAFHDQGSDVVLLVDAINAKSTGSSS